MPRVMGKNVWSIEYQVPLHFDLEHAQGNL